MQCQWTLARCPGVHQCWWWWPRPQPVTIVRTPHLPTTYQTVGAHNRLPARQPAHAVGSEGDRGGGEGLMFLQGTGAATTWSDRSGGSHNVVSAT